MLKKITKYGLAALILFTGGNCRKSYTPPEINVNHLYLSVDGLINISPNGFSTITLTRSQELSDTVPSIPETGARVSIKNAAGIEYPLTDNGRNGIYVSTALTLDPTQHYLLSVITANGNQYASDPLTPIQTPPIDSVTWAVGFDGAANTQAVNMYVNTHDPLNNTHFYRWDYSETWEHEAINKIYYLVQNKEVVYVTDTTQHPWYCWSNGSSTNILLGSSNNLSADIISQAPIARIYQNDPRLDFKYSILVKQYALDAAAYDYWSMVQKVSQSLGGLFDILPAQLTGNVHNVKTPGEPVFGNVSASSVQEKRLFISNADLPGWKSVPTQKCNLVNFLPDSLGQLQVLQGYYNIDPNFSFFRFGVDEKGRQIQILITKACIDCTFQGGSTVKPPFWQ